MDPNKQMKEILANSAAKVEDDFTAAVMKKVTGTNKLNLYQPLVASKAVKMFVFMFGAVLTCFLLISIVLTINGLPIAGWLQAIEVPDMDYIRLGTFLMIFWLIYVINALFQKRFVPNKPYLKNRNKT